MHEVEKNFELRSVVQCSFQYSYVFPSISHMIAALVSLVLCSLFPSPHKTVLSWTCEFHSCGPGPSGKFIDVWPQKF